MKKNERDNVHLVKEFYRALSSGDWTTARDVLDAEVTWIEPTLPGLWFSGTHHGADAVFKKIIEPAYDKFEHFRVRMKSFFPVGDHVVTIGRFHGRARATDLKLNASAASLWTLREGKAVQVELFHDALEWQVSLGMTSLQTKLMAA